MKWNSKLAGITGLFLLCAAVLGGCKAEGSIDTYPKPADTKVTSDVVTESMKEAQWETAMSTPLGRYPELVTYTLGKMTSENNSNMSSADTYENNNYTRYLRELLNVQNDNAFEGMGSVQYEQLELMAVQEGKLPDIAGRGGAASAFFLHSQGGFTCFSVLSVGLFLQIIAEFCELFHPRRA